MKALLAKYGRGRTDIVFRVSCALHISQLSIFPVLAACRRIDSFICFVLKMWLVHWKIRWVFNGFQMAVSTPICGTRSCKKKYEKALLLAKIQAVLQCYWPISEKSRSQFQVLHQLFRDRGSKRVNHNSELYGSCRHKTRFHRFTRNNTGTDESEYGRKSQETNGKGNIVISKE